MKIEWDLLGEAAYEAFFGILSVAVIVMLILIALSLEVHLWKNNLTLAIVIHTVLLVWAGLAGVYYTFLLWERHGR